MLGIAHHSPWAVQVFLDRHQFQDLLVTEDHFKSGDWRDLVKAFEAAPSDGRERILFIETVAALRTMVRQGLGVHALKVAVYDTEEALTATVGCEVIDRPVDGQPTRLSIDEFNAVLQTTAPGLPDEIEQRKPDPLPQGEVEEPEATVVEKAPEPEPVSNPVVTEPKPKAKKPKGKKPRKPRKARKLEPVSYELF